MPEDVIIVDDTDVILADKTWELVGEKMRNQRALIANWLA